MRSALLVLLLAAGPLPRALAQEEKPPKVEAGAGGEGEEEEPAEGEGGGEKGKPPAVAAKPAPLPVRAALKGSTASVCITLCDFRPEPPDETAGALLFGHLGEGRTTLSLTAEREDPKRPGAGRRDREAKKGEESQALYEAAGVPCLETSASYPEAPGARQLHFHAYPAAAGWSFDLHVSAVSFAGMPAFARADFTALVRTLRFGWFRRGRPDLLPPGVLEAMDGAARRAPAEVRFLEDLVRDRPKDGAVRLALGEALLAGNSAESAVAAFEKAADLLPATEGREDRFALWLALDGAAAAHLRAGRADRARVHLDRAMGIAEALADKGLRALTFYGQARCAGEKGDGAGAAELLGEAFAFDPSLRAGAKEDPCFRKVLLSRAFKAAVGE